MAVKVYLGRRDQWEGEACRPDWHEPYASFPLSRALTPGSLQSPHGRAGVGSWSFVPNTWSANASSCLLSIVHRARTFPCELSIFYLSVVLM